ncbi:MAG: hypothetical protein IKW28_00990, partial [Lachnospiraceae bacterium]|nr:hypothetical protein [Lachnospiraceae bacterium]
EEIKLLISKREFFKAVKIADGIDWTRVRSVAMLCTVSDLYKVNRRYKESKELLLMAYERHPNGRMIVYSLCELCLKMGEIVQAIEYYKEFVQLAPLDNGKYILQYKIYVAQDVSLEERIAVLEELKKRDYREKWGYELAYLYHRIGLATKCVEECDELILWFSDGRYVKKAMELKMLHQPLTMAQEASYNSFIGKDAVLPRPASELEEKKDEDIEVQPVNVGQYNTLNLQKALAESMKEVLDPNAQSQEPKIKEGMGEVTSQIMAPMLEQEKEVFYEDKTEEIEAVKEKEELEERDEIKEIEEMPQNTLEAEIEAEAFEAVEKEEEAVEVMSASVVKEEAVEVMSSSIISEEEPEKAEPREEDRTAIELEATKEIPSIRDIMKQPLPKVEQIPIKRQETGYTVINVPRAMEGILSQEYDGQITMVMPEEAKVEKQITGQMNIEDVLLEWEKTKKEYEEKRRAQLTQKVLEQTGNMFTDFEAKVRDGILEQLQKEENLHSDISEKESDATEKTMIGTANSEQSTQDIANAVHEIMESLQKEMEPEISAATVEADESIQMTVETESMEADSSLIPENSEEEIGIVAAKEDTAPVEAVQEAEGKEEEESEINDQEEQERATLEKLQKAQEDVRDLTEEEKQLFGQFLQTKGARRKFLRALDQISLSAYTGNVIVTGEGDLDTLKMAKNIMKDLQNMDANFSGVVAKVTGSSLNSKSVEGMISKLNNGGLIIEKASGMNSQAVTKLLKALNQEQTGIVIILEDDKKAMKRMLAAYPSMQSFFNARIELEGLNNDALAAYGRQYAAHLEYAIDDLGMLALQTKIEDRQTSDHIVTVAEVRELVDEAIRRANRKNLAHLFDLVLGKRYDEEDMIILREKDFI